jgi:hypothetical protein
MANKYYPCLIDQHGKIRKIAKNEQMTREAAENYLRSHYRSEWIRCEAIPQISTMQELHH